jgi:hypothetical protein
MAAGYLKGLSRMLLTANLFLGSHPVLLGRATAASALQIKLIGSSADLLLYNRRGVRPMS